jgi:hypothetical protein
MDDAAMPLHAICSTWNKHPVRRFVEWREILLGLNMSLSWMLGSWDPAVELRELKVRIIAKNALFHVKQFA